MSQMDKKLISDLSLQLDIAWNRSEQKEVARVTITQLFQQRSTKVIIENFAASRVSKERRKSINVAVLVLALLIRNLDDEDIFKHLKEERLIRYLYGGLKTLLSSRPSQFTFQITWSDKQFNNKMEYIDMHEGDFNHLEFIELFLAVEMIREFNPSDFEELVLHDKTKLLILNLATESIDGDLSDETIKKLLVCNDELVRNATFYLLVKQLEMLERQNRLNERNEKLENIKGLLLKCPELIKISLLLNYLLLKDFSSKGYFEQLLFSIENISVITEFIKDKKESTDLECLLYLVEKILYLEKTIEEYKNLSEHFLEEAVEQIIYQFEKMTSRYQWGNKHKEQFRLVSEGLPAKYKSQIINALEQERQNLLSTPFDELVRYKIYIIDKEKDLLIEEIISIISG